MTSWSSYASSYIHEKVHCTFTRMVYLFVTFSVLFVVSLLFFFHLIVSVVVSVLYIIQLFVRHLSSSHV